MASPRGVSASISTSTCNGGEVSITAIVTDGNSLPVGGATASGHVAYTTTGPHFAFPPTNGNGSTSTTADTGRPRGGYNVISTVAASVGGLTATVSTSCYAP